MTDVELTTVSTAVSPLSSFWTDWKVPLTIVGAIVGALLIRLVLQFVIRRVVDRVVSGVKKRQNVDDTQSLKASPLAAVRIVQRTRTLGTVLSNVVTAVIAIIALTIILNTAVPNITSSFALITAALGAGLGFGAQNIVKDVLNGLFMVAEDQLGVGDVVDLGPATGVVEAVGIRITQVRDVNGILWFVRNGEILRVGNMSQGWARVIIDLGIPYELDVDEVQDRMLATATELSTDAKWRSRIIEKPEIWGLESISVEALFIRVVIKTRSSAKDDVARELRMRLKKSLDEMDVRLPALNTIVLTGFDGATSVKGARPPRTRALPETPAAPAAPRAPGLANGIPAKAAKPTRSPRGAAKDNS
ncbi:MAG: mechanosensitive ion channel protein [Microbacteriaceae bacterium]|nr:mechanosensitive ion channel protein [Microbacteriaceae bacterium]